MSDTTTATNTTVTSTTAVNETFLGRIKWFNSPRGYGFVTNVKTNEDFFVHHSGVTVREECWKTLYPGEYVSYSLQVDENDKQQTVWSIAKKVGHLPSFRKMKGGGRDKGYGSGGDTPECCNILKKVPVYYFFIR